MSKEAVIISFFGNTGLESLVTERDDLFKLYGIEYLNTKYNEFKLNYNNSSQNGATYHNLKEVITANKANVVVLHFAGHGASNYFQFNEGYNVEKEDLFNVINGCKNLKLIVFNCCGDEDQLPAIKKLFSDTSVPAVIATKSLVHDDKAALFGTTMHKNLLQGYKLGEAFEETKKEMRDKDKEHPNSPSNIGFEIYRGLESLDKKHLKEDSYTLFTRSEQDGILKWRFEDGFSTPILKEKERNQDETVRPIFIKVSELQQNFSWLDAALKNRKTKGILENTVQQLSHAGNQDVSDQVRVILEKLDNDYSRIESYFQASSLSLESVFEAYNRVKEQIQETSFGFFFRRQDQCYDLISNLRTETMVERITNITTPNNQRSIGALILSLVNKRETILEAIEDEAVDRIDLRYTFDREEVEHEVRDVSFPVELAGCYINRTFSFLLMSNKVWVTRTFSKAGGEGTKTYYHKTDKLRVRLVDATADYAFYSKFTNLDDPFVKNNYTAYEDRKTEFSNTYTTNTPGLELQVEKYTDWGGCTRPFNSNKIKSPKPDIIHLICDQASLETNTPILNFSEGEALLFNADRSSPFGRKNAYNPRHTRWNESVGTVREAPFMFILQEWGSNKHIEIFELIAARLAKYRDSRVCFIPYNNVVNPSSEYLLNYRNLEKQLYAPICEGATFGSIIHQYRRDLVENLHFTFPVLYLDAGDIGFDLVNPDRTESYNEGEKETIRGNVTPN